MMKYITIAMFLFFPMTVWGVTPEITATAPLDIFGTGTTSKEISAITDQSCDCRYSTTPNAVWADMTVYSSTGGTTHTKTVTGLTDGQHRFYTLCQNGSSEESYRAVTQFVIGTIDMPIGIPTPSFGITDTPPATGTHCPNWPTGESSISNGDTYDCYFIDNDDGAATDASNDYGYPDKPRLTIPKGSMSAGSYFDIRGGGSAYTTAGRFNYSGVGTVGAPIWLLGNEGSEPAQLNMDIHIGYGGASSYFVVDGFKFISSAELELRPLSNGPDIDHIAIRNCEIAGAGTFKSGESFSVTNSGFALSTISDVVFYNNLIHDNGDWENASEDDTCCYALHLGISDGWVLGNAGYRSGGDGVILTHIGTKGNSTTQWDMSDEAGDVVRYTWDGNGTDPSVSTSTVAVGWGVKISGFTTPASNGHFTITGVGDNYFEITDSNISVFDTDETNITIRMYPTDHIYFGDNVFFRNRENGLDFKAANDVVASNNTIFDHRVTSSSSGEGVVVHYDPKNVWLIGNDIFDCERGIVVTGALPAYIIANLVHDINHTSSWNPTSSYSNGVGIQSYNSNAYIVDNTVYDYDHGIGIGTGTTYTHSHGNILSGRAESTGFDVIYESGVSSYFDYNQIYNSSAERIAWDNFTPITNATLVSTYSKNTNGSATDPKLTTPGSDFTLQADSPCINNSVEGPVSDSVYDTFYTLYSVDIEKDINGTARPRGGLWDMGAFEFNAAPITILLIGEGAPLNVESGALMTVMGD